VDVHLISGFLVRSRDGEPCDIPLAACGEHHGEAVLGVFLDDEGAEGSITCEGCKTWAADPDNRLMLLDIDAWIAKHAAAGDRDLRYTDMPVPGGEFIPPGCEA
jgi:hypothetical protein